MQACSHAPWRIAEVAEVRRIADVVVVRCIGTIDKVDDNEFVDEEDTTVVDPVPWPKRSWSWMM